jgi:hypothetical protein
LNTEGAHSPHCGGQSFLLDRWPDVTRCGFLRRITILWDHQDSMWASVSLTYNSLAPFERRFKATRREHKTPVDLD